MGTVIFRGDALAVPQVTTIQITADDAATTYKATINTKVVSVTGAGTGVNDTATKLQVALSASTIAEFKEITFTVLTDTVTCTGPVDGSPFTIASSKSGGAGTIGAATTTTSPDGPNWWSAANFDTGVLPAAADDVWIQNTSVSVLWGTDQNAVALTTLNIPASYTGQIGLHNVSPGGYFEYRNKSLKIRPGTLNIGLGDGTGSGFLRIDTGAVAACTANVFKLSNPIENGVAALNLQGSHASNVLNLYQGVVTLCPFASETANWPATNIGSLTQPATDVTLIAGAGCSAITTLVQNGGNVTVNCNVTTWTKTGGDSRNLGAVTVTTITSDGPGVFHWDSSGTITTATFRGNSYGNPELDNSRDDRTKTLTNSTFIGGGHFLDPLKKITFTNPWLTDATSDPLCNKGNAQFSLQRS